jgi:hypothetical protein
MGRKISQETSLAMIYEKAQFLSFHREHREKFGGIDPLHQIPEGGVEGNACEFRDFCNRLYYIDGKCRCMTSWRRSTGLALPVAA